MSTVDVSVENVISQKEANSCKSGIELRWNLDGTVIELRWNLDGNVMELKFLLLWSYPLTFQNVSL